MRILVGERQSGKTQRLVDHVAHEHTEGRNVLVIVSDDARRAHLRVRIEYALIRAGMHPLEAASYSRGFILTAREIAAAATITMRPQTYGVPSVWIDDLDDVLGQMIGDPVEGVTIRGIVQPGDVLRSQRMRDETGA